MTPSFSISRLIWIYHFNAILAIPNIRGGDEYGEEWHQGGILDKKQNVFDDFKYAAKTLFELKYTNPKKICIMGGSNGGLLVAACIVQDPDYYKCAVAQVPVIDMLRFHKFTIGYAWCSDYGCADNLKDFKYLIKYSPLHNIKKGKEHPALLILTADHDDRVVPLHSFKFISELQYQLGNEEYQNNPLLIKIDIKTGHGHGKPLNKQIQETADYYGFISYHLNAIWED
jgi:prolyl oligopeptidase